MPKLDVNRNEILKGIYSGKYTPENLPISLYEATAELLQDSLEKGYGNGYEALLEDFIENIYMFSAAKTFQQTLELSSSLKENGKRLEWAAFLAVATGIFDKYNETYLKPELDTTEWAAKSGAKWIEFEKKGVKYLIYRAEIDSHTCTICKPLDKILIDINDSFWNNNATPQHFNCRCEIQPVTGVKNSILNELMVSTQTEIEKAVKKSQKDKNPMFNYNPGKDRVIFLDKGKNKHPYFDVPKEYRELAKENFNLPLPKLYEQ